MGRYGITIRFSRTGPRTVGLYVAHSQIFPNSHDTLKTLDNSDGWIQVSNRHCVGNTLLSASYPSLWAAQVACVRAGTACGGVYDRWCDGRNGFRVCEVGPLLLSSSGSCVHTPRATRRLQQRSTTGCVMPLHTDLAPTLTPIHPHAQALDTLTLTLRPLIPSPSPSNRRLQQRLRQPGQLRQSQSTIAVSVARGVTVNTTSTPAGWFE